MSYFLDILDKIELSDDSDNYQSVEQVILLRNSLGENARRMLEIGIVQEELFKLGFGFEIHSNELKLNKINSMFNDKYYHVMFWTNGVAFRGEMVFYSSPTWQQDLFAKVRELIGDKS